MQTVSPVAQTHATPGQVAGHEQAGLMEDEHLVVCLDCGQAYDRRRLAHVLHHAEAGHDPLPMAAA